MTYWTEMLLNISRIGTSNRMVSSAINNKFDE